MALKKFTLEIQVPFSNEREAEISYDVLRVDQEPLRSQVMKTLNLNKNKLNVSFTAPTAQQLRVGVNGFIDQLLLVTETLNFFGPPVSTKYMYMD